VPDKYFGTILHALVAPPYKEPRSPFDVFIRIAMERLTVTTPLLRTACTLGEGAFTCAESMLALTWFQALFGMPEHPLCILSISSK
jgi:hypothetical protein